MAPFLSKGQFQLASGAGTSSYTAALQWSGDHNVSPVKRSGYALDPERHPSWWVSNRPRGIGGDPGFTEEQVHTRNRICASGARSYEDIIEEFVEKIVSRECHTRVFGATVQATAPDCVASCDQPHNVSSPCWTDCFYKAACASTTSPHRRTS